jgi:hypothetical protein
MTASGMEVVVAVSSVPTTPSLRPVSLTPIVAAAPTLAEQGEYVPMVRTPPVALEMHPETDEEQPESARET